jgi:hypothetical protein|tara:strand:+ start:217 stop:414 length:198 start_codon:yes stop_codon:yes gene_type:complete
LKRFGLCLGKGGFDKIQVGFVLLLEYGSAANGTFVPSATRIWPPPRQGSQQRVQKIRASDPQREI